MNAQLLLLALQAMEDPDAMPVLGDAILECGFADEDVFRQMTSVLRYGFEGEYCRFPAPSVYIPFVYTRRWETAESFFRENASYPCGDFARALAAVFLFGEWSAGVWPLITKLQVEAWNLTIRTMLRSYEAMGLVRPELSGLDLDVVGQLFGIRRHSEFESDEELRGRLMAHWGRRTG